MDMPITTDADEVLRLLKSVEQDADSVDTPTSYEGYDSEKEEMEAKMKDILISQGLADEDDEAAPKAKAKEDDDSSVSISSVEVSSDEED